MANLDKEIADARDRSSDRDLIQSLKNNCSTSAIASKAVILCQSLSPIYRDGSIR